MTVLARPPARFLVGIDLGTSNSALSFVDTAEPGAPVVRDFPIPQLRRPGEIADGATLPSCVYLAAAGELPEGTTDLPWRRGDPVIVGEFARAHGAAVPGRLVTSAKSWLCHPGVDRTAPILPWGAPPDVVRISPVEASTRFLEHLAGAWNHSYPGHRLADQELVITVPASFDVVARELTVEAARRAGLVHATFVEEPQAAFEALVLAAQLRGSLAADLAGVRLALVVDVGGGTTDFTLVRVETTSDGPAFRRIAVGDHLMLGGDNMDAALARRAEERLSTGGRRLDAVQWGQLVQACRHAKESLLRDGGPADCAVSVAGRGSALLGGSRSTRLTRDDVEALIVTGFFPDCPRDAGPAKPTRMALQELGLPYAQDPAITRQLAGFLRAHRAAGGEALGQIPGTATASDDLPRPDAILLNGGVFNAPRLADRLFEVLSAWWPGAPAIRRLAHDSLDLAVARGAAGHGLARRGLAPKISGGSSHAFYVGLDRAPGATPTALCVIPRGFEEGDTADLGGRVFRLALGRPVQFPLYSSTSDRTETVGDIVPLDDELLRLPSLHASLASERRVGGLVPVYLRAILTELGTLELWCVGAETSDRWRLEFDLRTATADLAGTDPASGAASVRPPPVVEPLPARFEDARAAVELVFPAQRPRQPAGVPETPAAAAKQARQLLTRLESPLGPRNEWRVPVLRELWGTLRNGAARRRRSPDHEKAFFQLAGFCLRPGFGHPLDDWHCESMASLFADGVQAVQETPVWIEFWVAWRRLAGGLTPDRQLEIWRYLEPHLAHRLDPNRPRHLAKPKGPQPEGRQEMVRLAAALEHLPAEEKVRLGGWIAAQLSTPDGAAGPWVWALGRLGARVPLQGSQHRVIPPDLVTPWVGLLAEAQTRGLDGALFALTQIARRSGDRARDLDDETRARVLDLLARADAPPTWVRLVTEVTLLDRADEARALGDTLPMGLSL